MSEYVAMTYVGVPLLTMQFILFYILDWTLTVHSIKGIHQVTLTVHSEMTRSRHNAQTGLKVKLMTSLCSSYNEVGSWESMSHLAGELRKGGNMWSLLCKMEMSLPRFAVAKLFWNGSHQKTLGRAGKWGHLQEQGSAFFWGSERWRGLRLQI